MTPTCPLAAREKLPKVLSLYAGRDGLRHVRLWCRRYDVHWQCWIKWQPYFRTKGKESRDLPGALRGGKIDLQKDNLPRDPHFGIPVGLLWTDTDGECFDEMNRNIWQIAFNIAKQWET